MNKEFIPYEQALELKELGFDEECIGWYPNNSAALSLHGVFIGKPSLGSYKLLAYAPLYQQAFRWFRERYLLHHEIACGDNVFWFRYGKNGYISILSIDTNNDSYWQTYEEAELACLKKLIEIVKNK
jgi:hypothetical protein